MGKQHQTDSKIYGRDNGSWQTSIRESGWENKLINAYCITQWGVYWSCGGGFTSQSHPLKNATHPQAVWSPAAASTNVVYDNNLSPSSSPPESKFCWLSIDSIRKAQWSSMGSFLCLYNRNNSHFRKSSKMSVGDSRLVMVRQSLCLRVKLKTLIDSLNFSWSQMIANFFHIFMCND